MDGSSSNITTEKAVSKPRAKYVPRYRSAPWAIVIALFDAYSQDATPVLTKKEIIERAQQHTDIDFTTPSSAQSVFEFVFDMNCILTTGQYYTGWSSMKTLKKHGIVDQSRIGGKVGFSLTDPEGRDLGAVLYRTVATDTPVSPVASSPTTATTSPAFQSHKVKRKPLKPLGRFAFDDLDSSIESVEQDSEKKNDVVRMDEDAQIALAIELSLKEAEPRGVKRSSQSVDVYDIGSDTDTISVDSTIDLDTLPLADRLAQKHTTVDKGKTPLQPAFSPEFQMPHPLYRIRQAKVRRTNDSDSACTLPHDMDTHKAYEVVVLVDNREKSGGDWNAPKICAKMNEKGIKAEVAVLPLGDILFVVRPIGYDTTYVTPHIIERKLLEDLAHSIRDNRYAEQKSRMKSCGFSRAVFLVEGRIEKRIVNEGSKPKPITNADLKKAMAFTWVSDGIIVVSTSGGPETTNYISRLYSHLSNNIHKYGVANVIDWDWNLRDSTVSPHSILRAVTYADYEQVAKKRQDSMTELFLRCLAQVPNVSADMASEIVSIYPTIASLRAAYRNCKTDKDGQKLLEDIKPEGSMRRLGPQISIRVYELFNT